MTYQERAAEAFPEDVAGHEMTVLLDSGLHRHLRFSNPRASMNWFELVTWPGHLAIAGDMGTYVFERTVDMFSFFKIGHVNLEYWAEKTQGAADLTVHSEHLVRQYIDECVTEWAREFEPTEAHLTSLRDDLEDAISEGYDDTNLTLKALDDFYWQTDRDDPNELEFRFDDVSEWRVREFSYHFVWCCYAIAWGIGKYLDAGGRIITNKDWASAAELAELIALADTTKEPLS